MTAKKRSPARESKEKRRREEILLVVRSYLAFGCSNRRHLTTAEVETLLPHEMSSSAIEHRARICHSERHRHDDKKNGIKETMSGSICCILARHKVPGPVRMRTLLLLFFFFLAWCAATR